VRFEALCRVLRAKFSHPELTAALLASVGRELVSVDTDPWMGMQAPGGIATGHNNLGKALMQVRGEFLLLTALL
jgi:predicted NAD-dependent protein-ADP-ribosyltransferase YbiA (DUF1768 family)